MREHLRVAEMKGTATKGFKWLIANFEAGDVVFHHLYDPWELWA